MGKTLELPLAHGIPGSPCTLPTSKEARIANNAINLSHR